MFERPELFVDANNGADSRSGESWASAIRSPLELARVLDAVVDSKTVPIVTLRGSFLDPLVIRTMTTSLGPRVVVRGEMQALREGVFSAFQGFEAQNDIRASFQDSGFDFSPYLGKRIRVLDGPAAGGVTTIAEVDGASALVGQFFKVDDGGAKTVHPVTGNSYVIEDYLTEIPSYVVDSFGPRKFVLQDLRVRVLTPSRCTMNGGYSHFADGIVFGCDFLMSTNATLNMLGSCTYAANKFSGAPTVFLGANVSRSFGSVAFHSFSVSDAHYQVGQSNLHQGPLASMSVDTAGIVEDLAHRCMAGYAGGQAAFNISSLGRYFQLNANARLWGVVANSIAMRVAPECKFQCISLPTVTGASQALVVGNTAKEFSEIPYIDIGAGTGNTGAMAVQGA